MLHAYDAAKAPTADQSFDVVSGRKNVAITSVFVLHHCKAFPVMLHSCGMYGQI